MPVMSEPKSGGSAPKRVRKGYHVNVYIDPVLGAAFDRFLAQHKPRTDKTGATELAFEKLLSEFGYWPSSDPPPSAG